MSKVYVCLLAGLLGLTVSAQQLPPGTNAGPVSGNNGGGAPSLTNAEVQIWIEGSTPEGASLSAAPDDPWIWTNAFWNGSEWVGPYSGSLMHISPLSDGWHQHFLQGLNLAVNPGDWLVSYVQIPWTNRPVTLMLEWLASDANGVASWDHRAFWGADIVNAASADGSSPGATAFCAGPLPGDGYWAQLALPASQLGLEGQAVQGLAFAIYDGTAAWDLSGKFAPELPSQGQAQGSGSVAPGGAAGSELVPLLPQPSCVNPPGGLVSWWPAEGNADDEGGGANGGVTYNIAYTTNGEVNKAFSFNGYNADVCVADSPNLHFTYALTVEAWVNPGWNVGQAILSKWDMYDGLNQMSYNFYLDSGGHVCLTLSPSGNYSGAVLLTSSGIVSSGSGTWTHVAGTFGQGVVTVYIDGVAQGSTNWAGPIWQGTNALGIGAVVGGGSNGACGGPFYGAIDEASVYSTCLPAGQILGIYGAGSYGKCLPSLQCVLPDPSLVSWWRAENDATDFEGLNNGIGTNVVYAPGKVGQAFVFNGSSANVWVADSPNLHFTNELTLEAWVKPTAYAGQAILSKWDMYNGLYQMSYNFYLDSEDHVCLTLSDTGDYTHALVLSSSAPVQQNVWTHVAATFGDQTMTVYVSGSPQGSTNWPYSINQGKNALGIGAVVGGGTNGAAGGLFSGSIDEASVYSQCLSAGSIYAIYEARTLGKCQLANATNQPQSQATVPGGNVTFSVAGGTPPFTYQWLFNSAPLAGATGSALAISGAQATNAGQYAVVVTGSGGSVTSVTAWLTVLVPGMAPVVWGDNSSEACAPQAGLTNAAAIAVGGQHCLAARDDGTVLAWGANGSYQTNVPYGLGNVIAVAAGANHSLALKANGTVAAWGDNTYGQINVSGLSNVIAIAAATNQSLALLSNGTVVSWGQTNPPVPTGLANVTAIAAGETFCLALIGNGTVVAWGQNGSGQLNVSGLSNVVAIAAGGSHGLALQTNGTVIAWGANGSGQTNVPAGPNNFIAVAAGHAHSLARRNDATTVAWGDNAYGQCDAQVTNVLIKLIAAGANHSMVAAFSPLVQYPINVTNDLLLVYNPNTADGAGVFAYYMANRPMITGANVLALTNCPSTYTITRPDFTTNIQAPLTGWLNANPTKRPQYMVLFVDVPVRINSNTTPFDYTIITNVNPRDTSVSYSIYTNSVGIPPFITHINMRDPEKGTNATAAPCTNYINKLHSFSTNSPGKLLISAAAAAGGYAGTNYVLDNGRRGITYDVSPWYEDWSTYSNTLAMAITNLIQSGVSAGAVIYTNGPPLDQVTNTFVNGIYTNLEYNGVHITNATGVAGYVCWGAHSGLGNEYPMSYSSDGLSELVKWRGASGWWLIDTFESFNGQPDAGQGDYWQWFSTVAFGSANYENTPVGAITHTDEPGFADVNLPYPYLGLWGAGKNFAICAWNTRRTPYFQAVGDPFVTR